MALPSQSDTSPFGSNPESSNTRALLATPIRLWATWAAWSRPVRSLSARTSKFRSLNQGTHSFCHFPAPIGFVVATKPCSRSRSVSSSPYVTNTGFVASAAINSDSRYRTRLTSFRFHIQSPLPSGCRWTKSLGSYWTVWNRRLPLALGCGVGGRSSWRVPHRQSRTNRWAWFPNAPQTATAPHILPSNSGLPAITGQETVAPFPLASLLAVVSTTYWTRMLRAEPLLGANGHHRTSHHSARPLTSWRTGHPAVWAGLRYIRGVPPR